MRILYIANHNSGGGDDEGAIKHALESLGHKVTCKYENEDYSSKFLTNPSHDFLLFHKWSDRLWLKRFRIPKVFWYFDLVDYPSDNTLNARCRSRKIWMRHTIPLVGLGFCTDGDWVNQDRSGKLVRLLQGADNRVTGSSPGIEKTIPILFTGIGKGGGEGRASFVQEMQENYGDDFVHIGSGYYQKNLADLVASAHVVVAPDHPCTNHYWSNRVYLMLGFKAFLLHPYAKTLEDHFTPNQLAVYYRREELHELIDYALRNPKIREATAQAGYDRTILDHTYAHRCAELIRIVQERIL